MEPNIRYILIVLLKYGKTIEFCLRLRMKIIIQIANLCRSKFTKKTRCICKSLLKTNTEKLMQILGDSVIKSVKVTDTADIIIEFENGVVMEFFIDYTWQNSEIF